MRLAGDDTIITIAGEAVRLRPSLRAAMRLEGRFGGFRPLLQGVLDGSITTISAIFAECGDHPAPESQIAAPGLEPLRDRIERITPAIVAFIFDLADVAPPNAEPVEPVPGTDQISLSKAFADIFGIATGVLGWTPATAWSATPAEIWTALDAHTAMLRAQNGIPDPKSPGSEPGHLDSAGLAELATM